MGHEIQQSVDWSKQLSLETRNLALREADRRNQMAVSGAFNTAQRTCDIEQEMQALNNQTGAPIDASDIFARHIAGAIPDTVTFNVEFVANGVTDLSQPSLYKVFTGLEARASTIEAELRAFDPNAVLVGVGVHPFLSDEEARGWVVNDEKKRRRYALLEKLTAAENFDKRIMLRDPANGDVLVDEQASNLTAMARCSGTQVHISETTIEGALEAYNIAIATASPMVALFANSPFLLGQDTSLVSSRVPLLKNAEQLRAGLPQPAHTLGEYYDNLLRRALPPFIVTDDPARALDLSMGAMHPVVRVQVDIQKRTIRNEFRQVDSQTPFRAMQSLLMNLGLTEGLRGMPLPTYSESQGNFSQAVYGLDTRVSWRGRSMSMRELSQGLINIAKEALVQHGMGRIAGEFLDPLAADVAEGMEPVARLRRAVKRASDGGADRQTAIMHGILEVNSPMTASRSGV